MGIHCRTTFHEFRRAVLQGSATMTEETRELQGEDWIPDALPARPPPAKTDTNKTTTKQCTHDHWKTRRGNRSFVFGSVMCSQLSSF